jgi:hypothetical protein
MVACSAGSDSGVIGDNLINIGRVLTQKEEATAVVAE